MKKIIFIAVGSGLVSIGLKAEVLWVDFGQSLIADLDKPRIDVRRPLLF